MILIVGATGFIGSRLASALAARGHSVIGAARNAPADEERRRCFAGFLRLDFGDMTSPERWRGLLEGVDAVVNAAGILRETRTQSFRLLHDRAPRALFEACVRYAVPRIVQISALGADEAATSGYHVSKRRADDALREMPLAWTIVQPSLVYGPGGRSAAVFEAAARATVAGAAPAPDNRYKLELLPRTVVEPVLILALTSPTRSPGQIYDAVSNIVQQKIAQVQGVGDVELGGGSQPAVRVELIPFALNRYGISSEDVRAALQAGTANRPKGDIDVQGRRLQIYTPTGTGKTAADYKGLVIAWRNGAAVRLADVADVTDGVENANTLGLFNGEHAQWVHIVDLDGAKAGSPQQHDLIGRLAKASQAKIQTGGGVRTREHVQTLLNEGVSAVVVGTSVESHPSISNSGPKLFQVVLMLDVGPSVASVLCHHRNTAA